MHPRTGEIRRVGPWRLRAIYDTNLTVATQAGRFRAQTRPEVLQSHPYWQYASALDARTTPACRRRHGEIHRADDPWWATNYPPNHWGCRAHVRGLTPGEVHAEVKDGGTVTQGGPDIFREVGTAGAGWGFNPGLVAWQPDLNRYEDDLAVQAVATGLAGPEFEAFFAGTAAWLYPVAVLDATYRAMIGADTKVVQLSDVTLVKNRAAHPELTLAEYRQIQEVIRSAQVIIQDGDLTLVFIRRGDQIYHATVKSTASGRALLLTSFRRSSLADIVRMRRRGRVVKDAL